MKTLYFPLFCLLIIASCNKVPSFENIQVNSTDETSSKTLFSLIPTDSSGVNFENNIKENLYFNFINYPYVYNGAGVATADFNNDGFVDIYITSNQNSNKLYLNKGNFEFEDITESAGVSDAIGWTSGVSIIDINNDGWMDIYISKSGSLKNNTQRENKLFINQKNNTFKESAAEWKLNDPSYSTQAYFFDMDKDGDLDMYLVNHRVDFKNTLIITKNNTRKFSAYTSDKLYRNDGSFFTDITQKSGILNNAWGLSASIGDFNNDGWPDIYVCNDFLEPDMLYLNNKNATFTDKITSGLNHISYNSMGSDFADINNDLLPDLMVVEMAAQDHIRSKSNMASMSSQNFNLMVANNYHHQYMVNTLQLNKGNGQFSDIAQLSGVSKTDWSWAPLLADYDNDGHKDLIITNGILKDLSNKDARKKLKSNISKGHKMSLDEALGILPSNKISNYAFKNDGELGFTNTTEQWGLHTKTQSNGIAYADFDNDGDLDIIINNINNKTQIYKNNSSQNFIQLRLTGNKNNRNAIGSKISIRTKSNTQYQELYTSRGYLSSIQNIVHFGLGVDSKVEELKIDWSNGKTSVFKNIQANQILKINEINASNNSHSSSKKTPVFNPVSLGKIGVDYHHSEKQVDDYKSQILLPHSQSKNGPFITKGDVNGDGLEDFYIGGAANQTGVLYLQNNDGKFKRQQTNTWTEDKKYEDLGVLFFDADNDLDLDLYIVSGSSEFPHKDALFQDRLYINDGQGNFIKSKNALPKTRISGQIVQAGDIDNDGDLDLFIGGRIIPDKYPYAPESVILINENGKFSNKTQNIAPSLKNIGMVTGASFSDYDKDGDLDLIVVGEWMPITIFNNKNGKLTKTTIESFKNTQGLWFSLAATDIDNDGDIDYFAGNLGLNTKYKASIKKPFHVYCKDYDNNGSYDIVLTNNYKGLLVPVRGKECSSQQMPFLETKFTDYQSFAEASLSDIYGEQHLNNALHLEVKMLESVFIENLGDGHFKLKTLPKEVQISPIMDFEFIRYPEQEKKMIIAIGNHYDAEVETVRYDASYGSVLSYSNNEFIVESNNNTGFITKGNAKSIDRIKTKKRELLIIGNNNSAPNAFSFNRK